MKQLLFVCLIFSTVSGFAAEKKKPLLASDAMANAVAHSLWRAKTYSRLHRTLRMTKNDSWLFMQDLKNSKRWNETIKYKHTPGKIVIEGAKNTTLDFTKIHKNIIAINGEEYKSNSKHRGYRQNKLQMDLWRKKTKKIAQSWLIPDAHAETTTSGPSQEDWDLINAYVDASFYMFDKLKQEAKVKEANGEIPDPTELLKWQYRNDEATFLQDMALDNSPYEKGSIIMNTFKCEGDDLAVQIDAAYQSSGDLEVAHPLESQEDPDFNKRVAYYCCQQPGTTCEEEAMLERAIIAHRHSLRVGKGYELLIPIDKPVAQ